MFTPPPDAPRTDTARDPIRLADWIELNLLADEESVMSVDSMIAELAACPPDDADDSEVRSPREDPHDPDGPTLPGHWNALEDVTAEALRELARRAGWLGSQYPLRITQDTAEYSEHTGTRNVYRFLVLLRARQLYGNALGDDGGVSGRLFEDLVKCALGSYICTCQENQVRFGPAGGARGDALPVAVADAVRALSVRTHEEMGVVPRGAKGDYRADAIAWKPFGDGMPGQLIVIGQATISEDDWVDKEPAKRWIERDAGRLIEWFARPVTAVAFPETLSLTSATVLRGLTYSSIPFDRLRLLKVLRDQHLPEDLAEDIRQWGNGVIGGIPR